MNDVLNEVVLRHGPTTFLRRCIRLGTGLFLALLLSVPLFGQYGGGTMGTGGTGSTPSYGNGKAIGIGAGAGAAGVAAIYLMKHRGNSVTGCVSNGGDKLLLTDDKTKRTFSLLPGETELVPGERVQLRGKIQKDKAGNESFEAKKLVRNLGSCTAESGMTRSPAQQSSASISKARAEATLGN